MTRELPLALVVAAALGAGACGPFLNAQSMPPPGRVGALEGRGGTFTPDYYVLEVSAGTALAILCTDGGPCTEVRAASRDPDVASVTPAALARLDTNAFGSSAPAASFVVIGKHPGTTAIDVKSKEGRRRIDVTVVAPPAPVPAMAARR